MKIQKFLRRKDVQDICGLPTSSLYELIDRGEFPRPINLSKRTVAWLESDILAWQEKKIASRDAAQAAS